MMILKELYEHAVKACGEDSVYTREVRPGAVLEIGEDGEILALRKLSKEEIKEEPLMTVPQSLPRSGDPVASLVTDTAKFVLGIGGGKTIKDGEKVRIVNPPYDNYRDRNLEMFGRLESEFPRWLEGKEDAAHAFRLFLEKHPWPVMKAWLEKNCPDITKNTVIKICAGRLNRPLDRVFWDLPEEILKDNLLRAAGEDPEERVPCISRITGREGFKTRSHPSCVFGSRGKIVSATYEPRSLSGYLDRAGFDTPVKAMSRSFDILPEEAYLICAGADDVWRNCSLTVGKDERLGIIDKDGVSGPFLVGLFGQADAGEAEQAKFAEVLAALRKGAVPDWERIGIDPGRMVTVVSMVDKQGRIPVYIQGISSIGNVARAIGILSEALGYWRREGLRGEKAQESLPGVLSLSPYFEAAFAITRPYPEDFAQIRKEAGSDVFRKNLSSEVLTAVFTGRPVKETFIRSIARRIRRYKPGRDGDGSRARYFYLTADLADLAFALEAYNRVLAGERLADIVAKVRKSPAYRLGRAIYCFNRIYLDCRDRGGRKGGKKKAYADNFGDGIVQDLCAPFKERPRQTAVDAMADALPRMAALGEKAGFWERMLSECLCRIPEKKLGTWDEICLMLGLFNADSEIRERCDAGKKQNRVSDNL